MRLVVANHSSYPRVGEPADEQRLRRAYAKRETGEMSDAGYREVLRGYVAEVLAEQADAGCDLVTDGQVGWYDLISHPASALEGVKITGLHRFFDTNHLVRRPEIVAPVAGSLNLTADYTYAATVSGRPVKPVLTGPYTLARHSIVNDGLYDLQSLTLAYADAVAGEVRDLAKAGAPMVQIEEPSLLQHPSDAPLVKQALERCAAVKGSLPVSLVTYFGDATPLLGTMLDMPVDMIGVDCTYSPGFVDELARIRPDRPIALGIVDGRNTRLDPSALGAQVERVAEALDANGVAEMHVQPSCGLEYLPRDRARRKLERLREIVGASE